MSPEAQRIAIAEACGWRREKYIDTFEGGSGRVRWKRPDGRWAGSWDEHADDYHLPAYLNDLNAMHEAEKMLTTEQWGDYADWLRKIASGMSGMIEKRQIHATAAQRAEAFLRTVGKWAKEKE